MGKLSPIAAAKRYVKREHPNCLAAFVAGSAITDRWHRSSDLDLVVVDGQVEEPFQLNTFRYGWLIEAFVMTPSTYRDFFEEARIRAIPTLIRMCAEGKIVSGGDEAKRLQAEAAKWLEEGPAEWSFMELDRVRYEITECLNDLEMPNIPEEELYLVQQLNEWVTTFILRTRRAWDGVGKWRYRSLVAADPELARQWIGLLQQYYIHRLKQPMMEFVDQLIAPFGGRLQTGLIGLGKSIDLPENRS